MSIFEKIKEILEKSGGLTVNEIVGKINLAAMKAKTTDFVTIADIVKTINHSKFKKEFKIVTDFETFTSVHLA